MNPQVEKLMNPSREERRRRELREAYNDLHDYRVRSARRKKFARERIGELADDWEMITSSGIVRRGEPGIWPPAEVLLGVPFTVEDLQAVYPDLVSESKCDRVGARR